MIFLTAGFAIPVHPLTPHSLLHSILIIFLLAFALTLTFCDNGGGTTPQTPDITISGTFTNGDAAYSATVKGATQEQADKIEAALDNAHNDGNLPKRTEFEVVFAPANGATIIVENTTAYANYKTTDDGKTLYLSLTCINGSELPAKLTTAVAKMNTGTPEIAKAIVPAAPDSSTLL